MCHQSTANCSAHAWHASVCVSLGDGFRCILTFLQLVAGMSLDPLSLAEQLRAKDAHLGKLAGTLAHYRAWASQIQARYQMFNPDAARPARRIYVGGLPPDSEEVILLQVCPLTLVPFLVLFPSQCCFHLLNGQSRIFSGFKNCLHRSVADVFVWP